MPSEDKPILKRREPGFRVSVHIVLIIGDGIRQPKVCPNIEYGIAEVGLSNRFLP